LRDPDRIVPFRLVNETTDERYRTSGDFDPERFRSAATRCGSGGSSDPLSSVRRWNGRVTGARAAENEVIVVRIPELLALRGGHDGQATLYDDGRAGPARAGRPSKQWQSDPL
jgi:hypothetical protein